MLLDAGQLAWQRACGPSWRSGEGVSWGAEQASGQLRCCGGEYIGRPAYELHAPRVHAVITCGQLEAQLEQCCAAQSVPTVLVSDEPPWLMQNG